MTKYVIKISSGEYVFPALKGSFPVMTREISIAKRFESMTEAILFALERNLERYKVVPIKLAAVPVHECDLGGEG